MHKTILAIVCSLLVCPTLASAQQDSLESAPYPPPIPSDASHVRVQWTSDYGFDVARANGGNDIWVTYDRPSPAAPFTEYFQTLEPLTPNQRVVARYYPGTAEGGFVVIDFAESSATRDRTRLVRAPRIEGAPDVTLANVERIREFRRCPIGRRRSGCLMYGAPEELAVFAAEIDRPRRFVAGPATVPRLPMPEAPPLGTRRTHSANGMDVIVAPYAQLSRGRVAEAAWAARGDHVVPLFSWIAVDEFSVDYPEYDWGIEEVGSELLVWMWHSDNIAIHAMWLDRTTLAPTREPFVWRDMSNDGQNVDCGNVFTDTRPVIAMTPEGPRLALVWAYAGATAILYDARGRHAMSVEARLPGGASEPRLVPSLFSVVPAEGGAFAIVPSLPTRRLTQVAH